MKDEIHCQTNFEGCGLKKHKVKVMQSAWGNWYGYLGSKHVMEFGHGHEAEANARQWLAKMVNDRNSR